MISLLVNSIKANPWKIYIGDFENKGLDAAYACDWEGSSFDTNDMYIEFPPDITPRLVIVGGKTYSKYFIEGTGTNHDPICLTTPVPFFNIYKSDELLDTMILQ